MSAAKHPSFSTSPSLVDVIATSKISLVVKQTLTDIRYSFNAVRMAHSVRKQALEIPWSAFVRIVQRYVVIL